MFSNQIIKLLSLLLYISSVLIFETILFFKVDVTINMLTYFSSVQLLLSVFILAYYEKNILSFRVFFIVTSFVFHLGHILLITIGYNTVAGYDMRVYTSPEYYTTAIIYAIRIHVFLFIGMLIGYGKTIKNTLIDHKVTEDEKENTVLLALFYTGIVLFVLGIIPKLYIDLSKSLLYIQGAYTSTRSLYFSGLLVTLADMANTGLILIMIGKHKYKSFCKKLFLSVLIYNLLYMITGSRGDSVITILILIFVYYSIVKKINIKNTISIVFSGYLLLSFLSFIANTRHLIEKDFSIMASSLFESLFKESPLVAVIAEFGVTIKTVFYSIESFPSIEKHSNGLNYIESFFLIFPNIGGLVHGIVNKLTFIYFFPNHEIMGGSYIGEMFYAFGKFGVVFAIVVGILIGKLTKISKIAVHRKKWIHYALSVLVFSSLLWWIRDYFYVMIREIFWVGTFIVVVYLLFKNKIQKANKIN